MPPLDPTNYCCNTPARLQARDVPEARWWKTSIKNPALNARHPGIETGFNKSGKLPSGQQHTPENIVDSQQPLSPLTASSPNLVRKVQTGKSGHTQMAAAIYTMEDK
eukprot:1143278-Pelagomonas_calceolata.AAC.2